MLTQKSSQGYCLEDVAILTHGKVAAENGLHASLTFGSWRWYIWSPASHMFELHSPSQPRGSYNFHQIQINPGQSIRTFSHAVPNRCQWKIDARLRAGSRRQNGSDAGPKSFELRFFLQGLRQKPHRWGAAWGILKRFNQRFSIETMLTQKSSQGYCLEDVAILTHGKVAAENGLHASLTFGSWRWYIWSPASHMFELHSPSQPRGSYSFHQIQASQFCLWKFADAHFRKRWQVQVLTFPA